MTSEGAKLAELAGQYLKKGRAVFIEGRLQMDTWEDKQTGQKRSRIKVVGENMQFVDSRRDGGGDEEGGGGGGGGGNYSRPAQSRPAGGGGQQRGTQPARQQPPANEEFNEGPITEGMEEDDIPF